MPTVSVQTRTHPNGWIMVPVIEGMLGLNFLRQCTTVRFDVPSGTLTLELP